MTEDRIISIPYRNQAATIIRNRIFRGDLKPGDLLSERTLSEELGISTTPIKEALRQLNAEGLVKTMPRKGTVVADIRQNLECVNYIRAALEGIAANFAARNIDHEGEEELRSIAGLIRERTDADDADGIAVQNKKLHLLLRKTAGVQYLSNLLEQLEEIDASVRQQSMNRDHEEREHVCMEHLAIADAVLSHESEQADHLMNRHIREGYMRLSKTRRGE